MAYPEGSYWNALFEEFPMVRVILRISGVLLVLPDGRMASSQMSKPADETEQKLWWYAKSIQDLM